MTWPILCRGVWWLATEPRRKLHPSLLAAMRREGLATDTEPPALTVKGQLTLERMQWAHREYGAEMPPARSATGPTVVDDRPGAEQPEVGCLPYVLVGIALLILFIIANVL